MKRPSINLCILLTLFLAVSFSSCKKKNEPEPDPETIHTDDLGEILVHNNVTIYNHLAVTRQTSPGAVNRHYSVSLNKRYAELSEAKAEAKYIDFMGGISTKAAGGRMLMAPNSPQADSLWGTASDPNNVKTWNPRNQTRFKAITMDSTTFEAIKDDDRIIQETASGMDALFARNLVPGSVFAFQLADGRKGIARVMHVWGNPDYQTGPTSYANGGSLTMKVKVQKAK